jgi:predicted adenylyl cyclase CyaB
MAKNIEIKAKVCDMARLEHLAASISDGPPRTLVQRDVFFDVAKGRLKLRVSGSGGSYLVYYDRQNVPGPRPSDYVLSEIEDPGSLEQVLTAAFGVRGEVRKVRMLYMVGRTRIHLDSVKGLGEYVELEAVIGPEQAVEQGYAHIETLLQELEIREQDLVDAAYIDLLEANK